LRARITHICARRQTAAEAGRALVGADKAVTDFREITENPDVDIVHICTPNDRHKEALLSAIRHNKHIYCEKPLVATLAEAEQVRFALRNYQATGQMTLQNRFFPATMRAKQLVAEGFLGQVLEARACYLHSGSADPGAPLKWKLSAQHGGGVIADLGPHIFDFVHFLLGDYEALCALTHIAFRQRPSAEEPDRLVAVDAEDCVMLLTGMKSGAVGNLEATKLATGTEDELRIEIHGSRGGLRFNGMDPHHLEVYDRRAPEKPLGGLRGWTRIDTGQRFPAPAAAFPAPKNAIGWMRGHLACLANFLQCVAKGEPGDPSLEHGIYLQHVMDCVARSAKEQRWMKV
jgi:predicted dehydrogenase